MGDGVAVEKWFGSRFTCDAYGLSENDGLKTAIAMGLTYFGD